MKKRSPPPPDHVMTPEEHKLHIEELLLRRCREIQHLRQERIRIEQAVAKKRKQSPRLLARCKSCGAYKFLMAAQKRVGK